MSYNSKFKINYFNIVKFPNYKTPILKLRTKIIKNLLFPILILFLIFSPFYFVPLNIKNFALSINFQDLPKVSSPNPSWYTLENQPKEALIIEYEKKDIRVYIGKKEAKINEIPYELDAPPYIKDGRTLVPLRFIAEGLGAEVLWDSNEKKVTLKYEGNIIELWIGKKISKVNGIDYTLDVPPEITKGRTFVPIRFIGENFGSTVLWNPSLKEVSIIKEKEIKRINENSDYDKDGILFKDEKALGTNPNDKYTVYNTLSDKELYELKQKYPSLNIFSPYPDNTTKLTLPEKVKYNLNPTNPYNFDSKINDEIVIKYALNRNENINKKEEIENLWSDFNKKYSYFIEPLKDNLNLERVKIIDKVGDLILKFVNLKLNEKLKKDIDKEFIKRVIEEIDEFKDISPLISSFSKEFVNQNKTFFNEIKNSSLEFISDTLNKYPTLTIEKQIELNNLYPELDFSKIDTFENPDKVSGLSLEEKIKYNINPLNPYNFDNILNDKKTIEYAKIKNLSDTKENILKAIKTIVENYGEKLGTAAKQLLSEEKINASELDAEAQTARTQVEGMFNVRAYKTKADGTKITLEDLTTTQRYKTLMLLNKTFGKEDINILLAQSKTLSQNPEMYSELINTLKTASHKIEEPVNQEIKDLRVFKNYINQWGLYDNNAGELAVKIWNMLSPELKEEVKQHPKLFLSYVGKYRAWAEAGKVKIGSKEYDFREVFDDIAKFTKEQLEYVIKMEKYFQQKGYELYEYSGYGRQIENLPFIWMQGSPFTPGLSHIELIKNKLSSGSITLKQAIEDMMTTEGAEEIVKIAEERYHNVPIGTRGCVSDFLGPGVGPKEYGSKPATSAMWVDVKIRGPPTYLAPTQGIPEANLPYGIIAYSKSQGAPHLNLTRKETTNKLIDLLRKNDPPMSERIPAYDTGDNMALQKIIDDALIRFTIEFKWGEYLSEQAILTKINDNLMLPAVSIINRYILQNKDWNTFTASEDVDRYYITPYEFDSNKPFEVLTRKIHFKKGEIRFPFIKGLY